MSSVSPALNVTAPPEFVPVAENEFVGIVHVQVVAANTGALPVVIVPFLSVNVLLAPATLNW